LPASNIGVALIFIRPHLFFSSCPLRCHCLVVSVVIMNNGMSFHTLLQSRSLRRVLFIAAGCITVGLFLRVSFWGEEPDTIPAAVTPESRFAKALVVSSQVKDDTSWLQEHLSNWDIIRYVVDDPAAQFRVPMNKGREAMVYLT
jgi:hypothetical protein